MRMALVVLRERGDVAHCHSGRQALVVCRVHRAQPVYPAVRATPETRTLVPTVGSRAIGSSDECGVLAVDATPPRDQEAPLGVVPGVSLLVVVSADRAGGVAARAGDLSWWPSPRGVLRRP
jgi:hypothetical protein